jgi:hypothetical protein
VSAFERILLQNDFERPATKFLIQGFNGQRKIDSSGGLLGIRLLRAGRMPPTFATQSSNLRTTFGLARNSWF